MTNRPTLVLVVRRDLTVAEFGVAVAHASEVLLFENDLTPDKADVVLKGARNEEVLLEVEKKLKEHNDIFYAFREEAASPSTGEPFRLAGQLVSIGLSVQVRDIALSLSALDGLHSLEDLDGPKVERARCEGRWADAKFKRGADGSPYRCSNLCAPGEKFCAKKACAERRTP